MTKIKGITCTQCGSSDIIIVDDNYAKCNACGTQLKFEKDNNIKTTITVKHEDADKEGKAPSIGFFKIREKNKIEDFTRTAYVDLFTSSISKEVCDAKFLPATTKTKNYLVVNSEYEIKYSASLGFDRKETYIGTERKYLSGGRYEDVLVEKEKTVTDYRPTNGTYNSSNNAVYEIGYKKNEFFPEISSYFLEEQQERFNKIVIKDLRDSVDPIDSEVVAEKPFEIEQKDLKQAYAWGAEIASNKCKNSLACDRFKGFSYTYKEKPRAIMGIVSNEFVLPFTMGKGKFEVTSFSNKIDTHCNAPKEDVYEDVSKRNQGKTKKSLFFPPIALFALLFILSFILIKSATGISDLAFGVAIATIFPVGIIFFIWCGIHRKTWESISKKQAKIICQEKDAKKCKKLEELLKEFNFAPLTEEEKARFVSLNKNKVDMKPVEKFVLWIEKLNFSKKK